MKKQIAILLVFFGALILGGGVLAQGSALPPGEYDLEAGQYVFNVPELVETPVPTDTPVPPTDTPVPSGHDRVVYHGLWNGPSDPFVGAPFCQSMIDTNCHWNHTHNADPSSMDYLFGPVPISQSISYPWETWLGEDVGDPPSPGNMENDFKHEGYKWDVGDPGICVNNRQNCITAWRIEHHGVGGPLGAVTRLHSFWAEIEICTPDLQTCGIMRQGGHIGYGWLSNLPKPRTHIPLPGDPPGEFVDSSPYREHEKLSSGASNGDIRWNWNSIGGFNIGIDFAWSTGDDWQGIYQDDPYMESLYCPDFQCEFNHSTDVTYRIEIEKSYLRLFDQDEDGIANYVGFTDREGNIVSSCSLGADCIPVELINVPVESAQYSLQHFGRFLAEYDVSPTGEFWIEYPN